MRVPVVVPFAFAAGVAAVQPGDADAIAARGGHSAAKPCSAATLSSFTATGSLQFTPPLRAVVRRTP